MAVLRRARVWAGSGRAALSYIFAAGWNVKGQHDAASRAKRAYLPIAKRATEAQFAGALMNCERTHSSKQPEYGELTSLLGG